MDLLHVLLTKRSQKNNKLEKEISKTKILK
jgi:hypothetical protein